MILRFLAVPSILEYFRGERRGGGLCDKGRLLERGYSYKLNFEEGRLLNKRLSNGKVKQISRPNFLYLPTGTFATQASR